MRNGLLALALVVCVSANGAETIQNAVSCGKVGSVGGLAGGVDLQRFMIDTARYPEAVCNDGTPAVFYYGAFTKPEDRGKWIIFLQGGGSCRSGQACAQRWCSIDTNFGMDKMTTSLSKVSIRGSGFLEPGDRNRFGSWNRVLVYYCSSDQWAGTKTSTLQATTGDGGTIDFQMPFKGSMIVDAVLDTLRYAADAPAPARRRRAVAHSVEQTGSTAAWPDLDEATDVIFAGSSGGGNGVRNNVDRVGAKLRATNPSLREFRAIIDAIYGTQQENLDFTQTTLCAADPAGCRYDTFLMAARATDVELYAARGDESCLEYHTTVLPGTEWRCADNEHVLLHHLTTPYFMRFDLLDELLSGNFVEAGFGTRSDYAARVEAEMRNLPEPEEPRGAMPGQFHPQCTDHEAFTSSAGVFDVRVDGMNWHDTVVNWWTGAQPQQIIRMYTGSPTRAPECP